MPKDAAKKKRQRWRPGDVIRVGLGDGWFGFGRVRKFPLISFYDLEATEIPQLGEIIDSSILFTISVMKYAVTAGDWRVIGQVPLTQELAESQRFFRQDSITGQLYIHFEDGSEEPATFAQIGGLECAAVWDPEHVVDRLNDHFAGRPNKWVDMLRPDKSKIR